MIDDFTYSDDKRFWGLKEEVEQYNNLSIEKFTIQDKLRTGISFFDVDGNQIFILQEIYECAEAEKENFDLTDLRQRRGVELAIFQDIFNDKVAYIKVNNFENYLCLVSIIPLAYGDMPFAHAYGRDSFDKGEIIFSYSDLDFSGGYFEGIPAYVYRKILNSK